jgi:multimeric flavodoxin WrbA
VDRGALRVTRVAIVYHSAGGRTRALAEAVARGAAAIDGTAVTVMSVADVDHTALLAADAVVFGCPTYMGSASAAFKQFMDGTSAIWAMQGWRDKLAAAFTHSAAPSGDKLGTLTQLAVFAAQHGMVWIGLGLPPTYASTGAGASDTNRLGSHLGAMAQSPPGGSGVPPSDLATAEHLGRRVAEAAARWWRPSQPEAIARHPTTRTWQFPPADRPPLDFDRINLRELIARPERFEHHLVVCATIGAAQLEIVTASEPLYFGHVNLSDEFALALPCGDPLIDGFPLFRTFVSDAVTGADVGRYNHRVGDLVLHPVGHLHWPGRLRPPYEPFEVPPGIRRCGLSLVLCASEPMVSSAPRRGAPESREADVKSYVTPAPPLALAATSGPPGIVAAIGTTALSLVERPTAIAPPRGGWVVVLEGTGIHAPGDLIRIPPGDSLDGTGIARALVLADPDRAPDVPPTSWHALPPPPFAPFEDAPAARLPYQHGELAIEEAPAGTVAIRVGDTTSAVPRYWLARMLFRCALHGLRLGYVETYGGLFVDDRGVEIQLGLRGPAARRAITLSRTEALAVIERIYRAVAPAGYRERLT